MIHHFGVVEKINNWGFMLEFFSAIINVIVKIKWTIVVILYLPIGFFVHARISERQNYVAVGPHWFEKQPGKAAFVVYIGTLSIAFTTFFLFKKKIKRHNSILNIFQIGLFGSSAYYGGIISLLADRFDFYLYIAGLGFIGLMFMNPFGNENKKRS